MQEHELNLLRLTQESNAANRQAAEYEESCRTVVGGFLSASDVCKLFADDSDWQQAPGASARRVISEKGLPFLEVGPGRFSVFHPIRLPKGAA